MPLAIPESEYFISRDGLIDIRNDNPDVMQP
jgi:hypothetical protein